MINTLLPTDHSHEHPHDDVFETPHPSIPPPTAPVIPPQQPDDSEPDLGLKLIPSETEPTLDEATAPPLVPTVPQIRSITPRHTVEPADDQRRGKFGRIMSQVFNRQDKRYPGLGFVQRCMGRARKSRVDSRVKIQLDNWQGKNLLFCLIKTSPLNRSSTVFYVVGVNSSSACSDFCPCR